MAADSQFLISGTASILGHKTHHQDDCAEQINETLRNVRALVNESQRHYGNADTGDVCRQDLLTEVEGINT